MQDKGKNGIKLGDNIGTLVQIHMISNNDVLGCHIRLGPKQIESASIRQISTHEMQEISDALSKLGDFDNCCNLSEICNRNYKTLLSFYSQLETEYTQNRDRVGEFIENTVLEMNRLLLNYLASFRTFLDHFQTRYSRSPFKGKSYLTEFNKIRSDCFDSSFYYRFFYKLRNFVQHCGLPVQHVVINEIPNHLDISIGFDRNTLLENYSEWGPVKKWLMQQPEQFEIIPSLEKLKDQIQLIDKVVTTMEIAIAYDSYKRLVGLINEVAAKYPTGQPFIGRFTRRNTPEASLQMTNFPFHQMSRFLEKQEEIQKFGAILKLPDQ